MRIEEAAKMLLQGKMAVIYDGDEREGEADLCFHASFASPERIQRLRKDAGGLICLSLEGKLAKRLNLPFYSDILASSGHPLAKMECKKAAYGDKPAFSLAVNHKGVYTGITDNDRSLTIRKMAELAESGAGSAQLRKKFMHDFYSPGHVFLLIGRGIENRHGHTELTLELARRAGMSGAMVLCEMLGPGNALAKSSARAYAKRNGFAFLEGKDLWRK
jgi:3,4-dihydroxy 2-butanone 4-phosphate synthase